MRRSADRPTDAAQVNGPDGRATEGQQLAPLWEIRRRPAVKAAPHPHPHPPTHPHTHAHTHARTHTRTHTHTHASAQYTHTHASTLRRLAAGNTRVHTAHRACAAAHAFARGGVRCGPVPSGAAIAFDGGMDFLPIAAVRPLTAGDLDHAELAGGAAASPGAPRPRKPARAPRGGAVRRSVVLSGAMPYSAVLGRTRRCSAGRLVHHRGERADGAERRRAAHQGGTQGSVVLVSTTRACARADGAERRRTHSASGRHCVSPAAAPPLHTRARAQSRTQTPTPSRALKYMRT